MPTTLPSSFASAAAGRDENSSSPRSARPEGGLYSGWSRRPNGATQTFRRTSTATSLTQSQQQREPTPTNTGISASGASSSIAPNVSTTRNGPGLDMRYSKTQLLELFRDQKLAGDLNSRLADLYVGDVDALPNGTPGGRWSRREEQKHEMPVGTEACWDRGGGVEPLGLVELTDLEKELFTSTINSTVKPSAPSGREQNQRDGATTRKPSMSQSHNILGAQSPAALRSTNRRRETSESYPFPRDINTSTAGTARGTRDKPASAHPTVGLLRRKTELMDSEPDIAVDEQEVESSFGGGYGSNTPSGSMRQRPAGPLSAGVTGSVSPWGSAPVNPSFPTMGAFGSFALGSTPASAGPGRSESRFRGLMSKTSLEGDTPSGSDSHGTFGMQGRLDQMKSHRESVDEVDEASGRNTLAGNYNDEIDLFTSTALQSDGNEAAELESGYHDRQSTDNMQHRGFQEHLQGNARAQAPRSPTFTNPYQSPPQQSTDLPDIDTDDPEMEQFHLPGLGGFQGEGGQSQQTRDHRSGDRTTSYDNRYFERTHPANVQTRGFPRLGGLGGLAGLGSPGPWSSNATYGTPTRERGFADMFSDQRARTPGEVQSPSLVGPTSSNAFGAVGGPGTAARSSRLGSLFSNSAQEQLRGSEHHPQARESDFPYEDTETFDDELTISGLNTFSSNTTLGASNVLGNNVAPYRDIDSPARIGRVKYDELFGSSEKPLGHRGIEQSTSNEQSTVNQQFSHAGLHASAQFPQQGSYVTQPHGVQRMPSLSSTTSNQPPAAQQKTMVMPDRIRWIYRDPQGNTQGPWSGLEMHDWYRAGFFSPELLVKKVEDADYEPLAQLIRRIGNSREPFLVPQIGIPGPPTSQSGSWPTQNLPSLSSTLAPSAQPPFAGSFPSFGTTLTAEQQNALERRKQEEQYLMARQKEHLAQQQMLMKQMQMQNYHGGRQQPLQHQPSNQSLHSQPSFGNIASPGAFHASSMQGLDQLSTGILESQDQSFQARSMGSGFDSSGLARNDGILRMFDQMQLEREGQPELATEHASADRLNLEENDSHDGRVGLMLADRAKLALQQAEEDELLGENQDHGGHGQKLQQFHDLRRLEVDTKPQSTMTYSGRDQDQESSMREHETHHAQRGQKTFIPSESRDEMHTPLKGLSLAEQIQQAASAKQSPSVLQAKSGSSSLETSPSPQSISPLPAPAARRNRSHVADTLAAESISQSESPLLETPTTASVAPWAREAAELHKLPSLKEIQEAEARQAAKQEEIATALRRAQLERDLIVQQPPPAPGLPSTSTWASADATTTTAPSTGLVWAKPGTGKSTSVASTSSSKKTMQQIVQEEEALARKKKSALAATVSNVAAGGASTPGQTGLMGKRYADLASKAASGSTAIAPGGAWTTVGASGKPKLASSSTAPAPATKTSSSSGAVAATGTTSNRPKAITTPSKTSLATAQFNAYEEFKKWAVAELRPDLHKDIHADDFVQNLLNFPLDLDLITEAVHMSSRTVDSRHFAEEFVRRRALADKGKVAEPSANGSAGIAASGSGGIGSDGKGGSGGWSEVARKGGAANAAAQGKAEESGAFKIVAAKKKGTRK